MGKNKANKKKNIFKVVGAKSLKAKSKAKQFTGNLKKIKETLSNNITKIDKDFNNLERDMRKKGEVKVKNQSCSKKENVEQNKRKMIEIEREKQNTLEKLSEMKF